MTPHPAPRQIERLVAQLGALRDGAIELEQAYAAELGQIEPSCARQRPQLPPLPQYPPARHPHLQQDLGSLGLSSLGVLEPHVLSSLNSVMAILEQLTGSDLVRSPEPPVDFHTGPLLLRDHTRALLGPEPRDRLRAHHGHHAQRSGGGFAGWCMICCSPEWT
jgi:pyruvate kinase